MSEKAKTLAEANARIEKLESECATLRAQRAPEAAARAEKAEGDLAAAEAQKTAALRAKNKAEAEAVRAEARAEAAQAEAEEAEQRCQAIEAEAKLSAGDIRAAARLSVLESALSSFIGASFDPSMKAPDAIKCFKAHTEKLAAARAQVITASLGIDEPLPVSGQQPGSAPSTEPKSASQVWQQNLKE